MSNETTQQIALSADAPLSDEQLAWVQSIASELRLEPGAALFAPGDHTEYLYLLLEGELAVVRRASGQAERIGTRRGDGEAQVPQVLNTPAIVQAKATTSSLLLRVPADRYVEQIASAPVGNVLLATLIWHVQHAEALLQQRARMAALGKMAAGLAHELNNPAAAASRAAAHLEQLMESLHRLTLGLGRSGLADTCVDRLRELQQGLDVRGAAIDPLERTDRAARIGRWLDERGIPDSWRLAPGLLSAGADVPWLEQVAAEVPPAQLADVLGWIDAQASAAELLEVIQGSTARIAELVGAVKAYAYMDQAPQQEVDVHADLDRTLRLLRHKLPEGISVTRDYAPDVPPVPAFGGELNQVWTNLLDNAIDALGGEGHITIRTTREEDAVLVEIADDGPGIPPAVQARMFEPFFTTKPPGLGTGLGLETSYRIVVGRHRGDIRCDSRPGATRFQVRLPLRGPDGG